MNFAELLVIALVALCVFGPKQLPILAKRCAQMVAKLKSFQDAFMHELNQESAKEVLSDNLLRAKEVDQIYAKCETHLDELKEK